MPWGGKTFTRYLGPDRALWAAQDATLPLGAGHTHPGGILVDQGEADQFLAGQLHPGYDHSYWFIQSVIADHLSHHATILNG